MLSSKWYYPFEELKEPCGYESNMKESTPSQKEDRVRGNDRPNTGSALARTQFFLEQWEMKYLT